MDLRRAADDYARANIAMAIVMMGAVEKVAAIKEKFKVPFICLADPEQETYRAFEIPRGGLLSIAGPRIWLAGLRALFRGGMGRPGPDVHQMHAAVVIDTGGIVQLVHYPRNSADHVSFQQVVAALG